MEYQERKQEAVNAIWELRMRRLARETNVSSYHNKKERDRSDWDDLCNYKNQRYQKQNRRKNGK